MLTGPLNAAGSYSARLMVDADVWRKTVGTDAGGGQTVDWVDQDRTVKVQLVSPSPQERLTAAQEGVELTHMAVLQTGANVQRGDRLDVDGQDDPVELLSDPPSATNSAVSRVRVKQEPWDEPTES